MLEKYEINIFLEGNSFIDNFGNKNYFNNLDVTYVYAKDRLRSSQNVLKDSTNIIFFFHFLLLQYFATRTFPFVGSRVVMVIGFSLARTVITSMATKAVSIHDTGLLLGMSATCDAFIRTIAPGIGTFLFLNYGWPSFGTFGATIDFGAVIILLIKRLS